MSEATSHLEGFIDGNGLSINMWNPNISYSKNDIVLYFVKESKQISVD